MVHDIPVSVGAKLSFIEPGRGWAHVVHDISHRYKPSARFKYVEALGRIIIGGPYPPSNAIIYVSLGNNFLLFFCGGPWATAQFAPLKNGPV